MELVNYPVILCSVIVLRNLMVTSVRCLYPVSYVVKSRTRLCDIKCNKFTFHSLVSHNVYYMTKHRE